MIKFPEYLRQSPVEIHRKFSALNYTEDVIVHKALNNSHNKTLPYTLNAALLSHNRPRNRYSNVLPYDQSRYKLKSVLNPSRDDYINASSIKLVSSKLKNEFNYIATQGPLKNTELDFWTMISEIPGDRVNIVMLTPYEENGKSKCFEYLHRLEQQHEGHLPQNPGKFENYYTYKLHSQAKASTSLFVTKFEFTTISLKDNSIVNSKLVTHYHILDWDDFSKPNEWETIQCISELLETKNNPTSTVVHCSAGVGRSGTFIVLDFLFNNALEELIPDNDSIDIIRDTVKTLREFRMMTVQSVTQFAYLYKSLDQFLQSKIQNGATDDDDEEVSEKLEQYSPLSSDRPALDAAR